MATAFCCLFLDAGARLVVGTSAGELLVWDVAPYWVRVERGRACVCLLFLTKAQITPQSASYWASSASGDDPRTPTKRCRIFGGPMYRLALWGEQGVVAAGKDGLMLLAADSLAPCFPVLAAPTPQQQCFNALATAEHSLYVGCEDGSLLELSTAGVCGPSVYEAPAALLDVAVSPAAVFVACADGTVTAVDRAARAAVWRIDLRTGTLLRGPRLDVEPVVAPAAAGRGLRASLVRLDASRRWLLCGGGSSSGGFVSVWHTELLDAVALLPLHSCPSAAGWVHDQVVLGGAEDHCHQFRLSGECVASSALTNMPAVWDVAVYQDPQDVVGASIAVVGSGNSVALLTAVGRKPILLTF